MTFGHFAVSSATNFVKAAGELANGVPPNSANRDLIFGSRLTRPLLATAPVRAKNQHTAAFLPGQFRSP
jgi:hypothetical protein